MMSKSVALYQGRNVKNICRLFLVLNVCSLFFCKQLYAEETEIAAQRDGFLSNLNAAISAGYQQSFWSPGLFAKDKTTAKLVEYKTEGLQSYAVSSQLDYKGIPILTLSYERPLSGRTNQSEMIEVNTSNSSGLEKFTAGVQLDAVLKALEDQHLIGKARWPVKTILSLRYKYSRELFFVTSTALTKFSYIDSNSTLSSGTVSGAVTVNPGDQISSKTIFKDKELTFDALAAADSRVSARFGYFESTWDRPSDNSTQWYSINGLPVLYDTLYKTKGMAIIFASRDITTPGFAFDSFLRLGFSNGISDKIHSNVQLTKKETLSYSAAGGTLWYNKYWFGKCDSGELCKGPFGLSVGGSLDYRRWAIEEAGSAANSSSSSYKPVDQEILYKLLAKAVLSF